MIFLLLRGSFCLSNVLLSISGGKNKQNRITEILIFTLVIEIDIKMPTVSLFSCVVISWCDSYFFTVYACVHDPSWREEDLTIPFQACSPEITRTVIMNVFCVEKPTQTLSLAPSLKLPCRHRNRHPHTHAHIHTDIYTHLDNQSALS